MGARKFEVRWIISKAKLKQKWAKLMNDDLLYIKGKNDEVRGRLQQQTEETREAVAEIIKTRFATEMNYRVYTP